jgi:hypothetical protein
LSWHLAWLWFWFLLGMATYWLKRAYYLVTGPNPIANTYGQFIRRCWIPLLVRAFLDSLAFWALFIPGSLADKASGLLGWQSYDWAINLITQFAPFSAFFGHTIDSVADILVSKVPWIKDVLPQMPGPLPQQAPADPEKK